LNIKAEAYVLNNPVNERFRVLDLLDKCNGVDIHSQTKAQRMFCTGVNVEKIFIRPNDIDDEVWYEKIANLREAAKQFPHFAGAEKLDGVQMPSGRVVRATAIEKIFNVGHGLQLRTLFGAVSLFDRHYA
jgi:hypothetical protein